MSLPDVRGRCEIIVAHVYRAPDHLEPEGLLPFSDDLDVVALADLTEGMSGADITEIFRRLRLSKAMQEARGSEGLSSISQADIVDGVIAFKTGG